MHRRVALLMALLLGGQPAAPSSVRLSVTDQTFQTIDGFGFCEAFQRANALYNAPKNVQDDVLDLLFDAETGAGLSIVRIGLGSSPNSTADHMNSIEPSPPKTLSSNASRRAYTWDRNASGQVWLAKRARDDYGVTTFYADAWSAPGYMKTNGRDDNGGYLCGVRGTLDGTQCTASWVAAYVDYLVAYVRFYLDEGIALRYIGFLNEPNLVKPYATMLSDGAQAVEVIRPLHAALLAANLSTRVSCCEAQGWSMQRDLMPALASTIADGSLALITTHAYKGSPAAPDGPLAGLPALDSVTGTPPPVWISENSPIMQRLGFSETWYRNGSENEGLTWANNLHTALAVGSVNAYLYWIGAGQWAADVPLIFIGQNASRGGPRFNVAATYWATTHWSRFVRPGAVRVGVNMSEGDATDAVDAAVRASAYRNTDGSLVVVAINNGDGNVTVTVRVAAPKRRQLRQVARWLTDNTRKLEQGRDNVEAEGDEARDIVAQLPPRSLTTFRIHYRWRDSF